jgi:hypothetical protein
VAVRGAAALTIAVLEKTGAAKAGLVTLAARAPASASATARLICELLMVVLLRWRPERRALRRRPLALSRPKLVVEPLTAAPRAKCHDNSIVQA